jgi:hypothetical protein
LVFLAGEGMTSASAFASLAVQELLEALPWMRWFEASREDVPLHVQALSSGTADAFIE